MSFYSDKVCPHIVTVLGNPKPIQKIRQQIIPFLVSLTRKRVIYLALELGYRAAAQSVHRDMTLLTSTNQGVTFYDTTLGPWELNACPMTTAYLSEGGERVRAAWETAGQVYFDSVEPVSRKVTAPIAAPGESNNRKHPEREWASADGLDGRNELGERWVRRLAAFR
jgi:hypothetical protein